jgi:aspartate-semialdehyde dehydrogenase
MNKDSKIYVAGHNGMVGSALVRKLKELGYSVYEMWESDWDKGKNAIKAIQRVWKSKH